MRDLFIQVVNMSLTASWLIVAVMVSRLFLTRTSKSLVCFLWILVGVRLILPISFESRMSVVPTLEPIVIHQVNEVVNTGEITVQGITNSYEVVTSLDWLSVISYVWMIGMAVLLVYALYSYWQLQRKVAASIEIGKDIYICDDIDGAFILGIWNPKIYLPSSLPYTDRNYVLMHEFTHLKRKDYMIKPLAYAVLILHWFNPLVWMSYVLLCKDMEMVCDEEVVKEMDLDSKKEYSNTLLKLSSKKFVLSCPVAFSEVGVKERVKNVLRFKKSSVKLLIVSILVCIGCVACFATGPKDESEVLKDEWKKNWTNQFLYIQLASHPSWVDPMEADTNTLEYTYYNHWEMKDMIEQLSKNPRGQFVHDWNVAKKTTVLLECLNEDEFSYNFYHHQNNDIWPEDDLTKDYSITFNFKRGEDGIFTVDVVFSEAMQNYKDQLVVCELLNAEEAAKIALEFGNEEFLDPQPTGE